MKTIEVYSEQRGWVVVKVEDDCAFDRAFDAAKSLETRLRQRTPVRIVDDRTGRTEWSSNG